MKGAFRTNTGREVSEVMASWPYDVPVSLISLSPPCAAAVTL
jgi:hypothetical protein